MRNLTWLLGMIILCALAAWLRIREPEPALFRGELVRSAYSQSWRTADSGSSLSMSPGGWMSDVYDPRFGESSAGAQCGAAEFERFVRGLQPFEDLFRLREPTDEIAKHPFHEIDVDGAKSRYIWLVAKDRPLSRREQALEDYISSSWLRLNLKL